MSESSKSHDAARIVPAALDGGPAAYIQRHQELIMNRWLARVMDEIAAASTVSRSEVANHLLALLESIVQALSQPGDELSPGIIRELSFVKSTSMVHARERASIEAYSVGDVVHEYILLRHVITDCCKEHSPLDSRSIDIINRVIEYSSLAAVNEFVRVTNEVKQKLVGSLVHDVRTPLGVAYNYVELLGHAALSDDIREQAVRTITRNLQRAVNMLEELLDFMKLRGGIGLLLRFETADLDPAFRNACVEAQKIYSRTICFEGTGHPIVGIFDVALVTRSIENLISNAVKHGYADTAITVSWEDHGDHLSIRVHNAGDPIAQEDMSAIFTFFSSGHQAKDAQMKSWGVGLTLIRTVVASHGGEVILESSKEHGTTFGMTLYKHHRSDGEEEVLAL